MLYTDKKVSMADGNYASCYTVEVNNNGKREDLPYRGNH